MKVQADTRAASTAHHNSPGKDQMAIVPVGGMNLLADGEFNQSGTGLTTPWTLGDNWSIVVLRVGRPLIWVLKHTPGSTATAEQAITITPNTFYSIAYEITGRTAGSVTVSIGDKTSESNSSNARLTDVLRVATASPQTIVFTPTSGFDGSIQNITVNILHKVDTGIVTDPSFAVAEAPAWTFDDTWVHNDANDNVDIPNTGKVEQAVTTVAGRMYFVQLVLVQTGGTTIWVTLDDSESTSASGVVGSGTKVVAIIPGVNNAAFRTPATNGDGTSGAVVISTAGVPGVGSTLDDVEVFELSPGSGNLLANVNFDFAGGDDGNWTLESGWTIGSGVATCDGTDAARIHQDVGTISGADYLVQYDITAYTSGSVAAEVGGNLGDSHNAVGTFMQIIKAGDDATFVRNIAFKSNSFSGAIDNVEIHLVRSVPLGERRVFEDVHLSYDADPTGGEIAIVGQNGILHQQAVSAKGPEEIEFEKFFYAGKDDSTVAVLQKAGAAVSGRLNATIR